MSQQIYKANGLHTPLWSGLHSGLWSPFSGSALAGGGVGPSGDPGDTLAGMTKGNMRHKYGYEEIPEGYKHSNGAVED